MEIVSNTCLAEVCNEWKLYDYRLDKLEQQNHNQRKKQLNMKRRH